MNLPDCIDVTLCVRLVHTLGHFLWQGVFVFLIFWLVMSLMQRSSSSTRYTISLFAFLLMAICPIVTFMLLDQAGQTDMVLAARLPVLPSASVTAYRANVPPPVAEPQVIAEKDNLHIDWRPYAPYVAMGYLLSVIGMLVRLFLAMQGGLRMRRRSQPVSDPRLLLALARQVKVHGLSFTPAIRYCRQVVVPTVIGVLHPIIMLPMSMSTGLSTEQIEAILAHELAHVRRYDHLVNILQRVIESVLFFHPCVWLISRHIRIEREICCDDLVLAKGIEPVTYADSLCRMAEIIGASRAAGHPLAVVAAVGAADSLSPLRLRILRLLEHPAYKPVRLAPVSNFTLILVSLAITLATVQLVASSSPVGVGDMTIKSSIEGNVYILGQVIQPGAYPIPEGKQLTMMQLINATGGYDGDEIEQTTVKLSRYQADGGRLVECELGLNTLIHNQENDVFLRNGDLVTLSSKPFYRPQYYTRLVVGASRITFEGHDVTLDKLQALLQTIPNRPYTLICIAMAEDDTPTDVQFNAALRKTDEIIDEYGFEGRVLCDPRPLGDKAGYAFYLPIESMHQALGKVIPVNDTLLATHTSDPPGQPQYAVRLIVGADRMTFQGQEVTWNTLPAMLQAVPNRNQTFFEITTTSDSPPSEDKFYDAVIRADELQEQFGLGRLRRLSRSKPLGSLGLLTFYYAGADVMGSL